MRFFERLLKHREGMVLIGQALHRGDLTLIGLNGQHQTGAGGLVID
jgi:hypothetical protein